MESISRGNGVTVPHNRLFTMRELKQLRRRQQRERQKSNRFDLQNNNFARASRFFVHFFAVVAWQQRETAYTVFIPISAQPRISAHPE